MAGGIDPAAADHLVRDAAAQLLHSDSLVLATSAAPAMTRETAVGKVVVVPMDPATNNGLNYAPAIITQKWTATTVNVRIIGDGKPQDTDWRTSVTYVDRLDELASDDPAHFARWTWPPRF